MALQSKTGKAGSVTISGVNIPITKWNLKVTREYADSTDSSNYDTASTQLFRAQLPGVSYAEGSIEFHWDAATTSANIISRFLQDPTLPCVFKIDANTTFASGNFDITDADMTLETPGATMVHGTSTVKSNGKVTYP